MDVSELRPADILLSTGDAAVSAVIRVGTASRFSHSALYAGNSEIIEAIGQGVVRQPLARAISDDTLVAVYRRIRMADEQATRVVRYASMQIGKPYDQAGAIGAGVTSKTGLVLVVFGGALGFAATGAGLGADIMNRLNPERSFFCSELVALAFENAGVSLGSGAASSTPADISSAHLLNLVGYLKGSVS